jgi:hypothetical protein
MKSQIIFGVVAIVAAIGLLVSANHSYASIKLVTTDTSCTNGGGNQPGGQQPSCGGSGLTQQTTTENQNPSGSAPPGQNK